MTGVFFHVASAGWPRVSDGEAAARGIEALEQRGGAADDPELAAWVRGMTADPLVRPLLESIFSHSPFLTGCVLADLPFLRRVLTQGPDTSFVDVVDRLKDRTCRDLEPDRVMRDLRVARRRVALLVALADITGYWRLDQVTHALSDFADTAVSTAISHLLLLAADKGDLALADEYFPEDDCGYVALAMGKHGARELNYSSDIDLIILYEPMKVDYRGRKSLQQAFVRMTHRLATVLQDRTADGYVCRVDLRLRPDPGSTPAAIPCAAALSYYAHRGENWERAAMIKARPAAGDLALGRAFLAELDPFIWRDQLDFWTAREIQAIKQRINAQRGGGEIGFLGHNIKLGRGGIREIEFFTQTQQLIFAGRDPYLRCPRTVEALTTLAEAGRIDDRVADELTEAYEFLRRLEHRLQMVDDQQTQTLPADETGMARIAGFMGFEGVEGFEDVLLYHLRRVEAHYDALFEEAADGPAAGSFVLAGEESDEGTAALLRELGFRDPAGACGRLRRWREAGFRATRDERSRKLLKGLTPRVVGAVAKTSDPDRTLEGFEDFLAALSAGVRCLSLLSANPRLLDLLVEIVEAAPALAQTLGRRPEPLQAALSGGFFNLLPGKRLLAADSAEVLRKASDLQDFLERAALWTNDQRFQVAANVMRFTLDSADAAQAFGDIAEVVLRNLYKRLCDDFVPASGRADAGLVVVALGAFGARELTIRTPLDLLFLYQDDPGEAALYPRLARRLTCLLCAPTAKGRLCQVDLTAGPWGAPGPLITPLEAFRTHCAERPEVPQLLTLCRARVVAGPPDLIRQVERALGDLLRGGWEARAVAASAPRRPAEESAGESGSWDPRHRWGGLDDLDRLVRVLQLQQAHRHPEVLDISLPAALAKLGASGLIDAAQAKRLIEDHHLLRQIENLLAVALDGPMAEATASEGLKVALARAGGAQSFEALGQRLEEACERIGSAFGRYVEDPAGGEGS